MISCFNPIFDKNCKLLVLGSCPSVKSLQKGEYYGHPQNRFWRVVLQLLKEDFTADYQAKKQILLRHGVGLWDTIGLCKREGSLDSEITDEVPNDVIGLITDGTVRCIALNGGKAKQVFLRTYKNSVKKEFDAGGKEQFYFVAQGKKIRLLFLPSTSPANAKMSLQTLTEVWQKNLQEFL